MKLIIKPLLFPLLFFESEIKFQKKKDYTIFAKTHLEKYIYYNAVSNQKDTIIIYEIKKAGKDLKIQEKINEKELVLRDNLNLIQSCRKVDNYSVVNGVPEENTEPPVILFDKRYKTFEIQK